MIHVRKSRQTEQYPELVEAVHDTVDKVANGLGLDDTWRFKLSFKRIGDGCVATCECEWEYRLVFLTFDLKFAIEEKVDLERAVVHEMCHIPLWKTHELIEAFYTLAPKDTAESLHEQLRKVEEEAVTFLEHAPMWEVLLKGEK